MEPSVEQGFSALRDELRLQLPKPALAAAAELRAALPDWRRAGKFIDLGKRFARASATAREQLPTATLVDVNRLLVAELALTLGSALQGRSIPSDVLALVPAAATRLLGHLRDAVDSSYAYPDDFFVKDLRFAAGLTVPGGAEVLDLRSTLGTRVSVQLLRRQPTPAHLWALLRSTRIDPWFRIHTESRYLRHFHESGWDAFYHRVASLLESHPGVRGVVGTSWFFDPQLDTVSPRLAYLRNPLARGAFLVRGRTGAFDIASATSSSEARKKLYEAGSYVPVPYALVWPRAALLQWSTACRTRNSAPA